jgi:hypothetical protein
MQEHHLSTTVVGIVLAVVAALFFGGFVLYGAWIDGRRQKVRDKGLHPVTQPDGEVEAREQEHG